MHSVSAPRPQETLTEREMHSVSVPRHQKPLTERNTHSVSEALPGLIPLWTRPDALVVDRNFVPFVHALTLKPRLAIPAWGILFHVCINYPEGAA